MQQRKARRAAGPRNPPRPGPLSLVLHILKGACANGMQIPALVTIVLTAALYQEKFPYYETLSVVLVGGLVLIGLLRGCASWQEDLAEYQQDLAMQRHQEQLGEANRGQTTGRYIPYTHR
jgi:hypothetical protein